jgi:hypothetical protein
MKRIVRLTESDLARIVRRVIREQEESTAMSPIVTQEVPLVNAPNGANGMSFNIGDANKNIYQDITVKGGYTLDPKTGKQSTNFVRISFFVVPSLYTSLTYDCSQNKVIRTDGEYSGKLPAGSQLQLLGKREGNKRLIPGNYTNYGQALSQSTKYIDTATGPAAQVISKFCKVA